MFLHVYSLWPAVAAAVNRNDKNQQKTTTYGGVRRARWSSQSQKYVTRRRFRDRVTAQSRAVRTRRWDLVAQRLVDQAQWPPVLATAAARQLYMLLSGGDGDAMVLVRGDFVEIATEIILDHAETVRDQIALSLKKPGKDAEDEQVEFYNLYRERKRAVDARFTEKEQVNGKLKLAQAAKDAKAEHQRAVQSMIDALLSADNNVDVAFNGRMIAENKGYNVDPGVHVSHAISVDPWDEGNLDYFTVVDDLAAGDVDVAESGMIGHRPNGTALYYRTATVALSQVQATLGCDRVESAKWGRAWIDDFVRALPVSMQTSTVATSAPVFAGVCLAAAPVENPVPFCADPITGYRQRERAAAALLDYHGEVGSGFGAGAIIHYWTPLSLGREATATDQPHDTWPGAIEAAMAALAVGEAHTGE